ncbi:hypothetical protein FHS18_006905 [Paenibacillus phyllosphaerae]|uniref:Uncharacterized protein n=1 Tax=Paenibacillus phyllosphaerae TaxID=274593 RepID=A0A7W5FRX3_9BACL|nr:hypothetical protein [Paenibacillus phyllosphaerae]MBB3114747.1 hypothetical protein [Paenibacillus phyllosphaerae]
MATIDTLSDWLEEQTSRSLLIQKEEQGDLDQVMIHLNKIDYRPGTTNGNDDYTNSSALLLHGEGVVLTDAEQPPLPGNVFEIPLEGLTKVEAEGTRALLQTERGTYHIIQNP